MICPGSVYPCQNIRHHRGKETINARSITVGQGPQLCPCGQWQFFCNYLLHPALGPSNQRAENGIRPFVVGRKNFLFAGHPNGAKALAIYYTLIETAKANGVRPLNYLKHIFSRIRSTPGDKIAGLLPWNCDLS